MYVCIGIRSFSLADSWLFFCSATTTTTFLARVTWNFLAPPKAPFQWLKSYVWCQRCWVNYICGVKSAININFRIFLVLVWKSLTLSGFETVRSHLGWSESFLTWSSAGSDSNRPIRSFNGDGVLLPLWHNRIISKFTLQLVSFWLNHIIIVVPSRC